MAGEISTLVMRALRAYFEALVAHDDPTDEMLNEAVMLDNLMRQAERGKIELAGFAVLEPILQQPVGKCFQTFGFSSKHAMYRAIKSGKFPYYQKRGGRILVNVDQAALACSLLAYPDPAIKAYADAVRPERELAAKLLPLLETYFAETKERDEKGLISFPRPEGY